MHFLFMTACNLGEFNLTIFAKIFTGMIFHIYSVLEFKSVLMDAYHFTRFRLSSLDKYTMKFNSGEKQGKPKTSTICCLKKRRCLC